MLNNNITGVIDECEKKEQIFTECWNKIGNILHKDVVVSENEENNKLIHQSGNIDIQASFSHVDLCQMVEGYDPERGSKVMGSR
ncbi:MAG: hypothetical protein MHPSP_004017, partial [Paramarteilia canceri]